MNTSFKVPLSTKACTFQQNGSPPPPQPPGGVGGEGRDHWQASQTWPLGQHLRAVLSSEGLNHHRLLSTTIQVFPDDGATAQSTWPEKRALLH